MIHGSRGNSDGPATRVVTIASAIALLAAASLAVAPRTLGVAPDSTAGVMLGSPGAKAAARPARPLRVDRLDARRQRAPATEDDTAAGLDDRENDTRTRLPDHTVLVVGGGDAGQGPCRSGFSEAQKSTSRRPIGSSRCPRRCTSGVRANAQRSSHRVGCASAGERPRPNPTNCTTRPPAPSRLPSPNCRGTPADRETP